MIKIVIENAGAERGLLILEKGGAGRHASGHARSSRQRE